MSFGKSQNIIRITIISINKKADNATFEQRWLSAFYIFKLFPKRIIYGYINYASKKIFYFLFKLTYKTT